MTLFINILSKFDPLSNTITKNLQDELKKAQTALEEFGVPSKRKKNGMVSLQSITEDADDGSAEVAKASQNKNDKIKASNSRETSSKVIPNVTNPPVPPVEVVANKRVSKKRSKEEVDDMSSPEHEKRPKRHASVKAQGVISQQVNVNLTSKLRREESTAKPEVAHHSRRKGKMENDSDKENNEPKVQVKQEKISLPAEEAMDCETLPLDIVLKKDLNKDEIAMPPPVAPVSKPRGRPTKERASAKSKEMEKGDVSTEDVARRSSRSARPKKNDAMPPPPAPVGTSRSTRASRRTNASRGSSDADVPPPSAHAQPRPKRTRGRKKQSLTSESGIDTAQESGSAETPEKPRPKRTRRGKAAQKAEEEQIEEVQPKAKDSQPKTKDGEPKTKDGEPKTKDGEPKTKDGEPKTKDGEPKAKDGEPKAKEIAPKAKDSQPKTKDTEPKAKDSQPKAKDIAPKAKDSQPKAKDIAPKAKDSQPKAKDSQPKAKDTEPNKPTHTQATLPPTVKQKEPEVISIKQERLSEPATSNVSSPILNTTKETTKNKASKTKLLKVSSVEEPVQEQTVDSTTDNLEMTHVISTEATSDVTVTLCNGIMDQTVDVPHAKYAHAPNAPEKVMMNETVVLDTASRQQPRAMDCTVVLEKLKWSKKEIERMMRLKKKVSGPNITDDNSILTDDNSDPGYTPPKSRIPVVKPVSAVKEKVQKFEELATRQTRTKTRAMVKKDDSTDNHTPPDKIMTKPVLSVETLTKMNSLIFNGKQKPQISSSASKPHANVVSNVKTFLTTSSTSKVNSLSKHKEAAEQLKKEREDARKKKEAILEAKKEEQKRKREEKIAAAAAAREAAERERQLAIEAAAKERMEKQAHADLGKLERAREAERKKQELARKVAETEERRRAEERARQQRLAEEQRRAELARKKQCEEQEATRKEAALMEKEIEKRQKEYILKMKMKQRIEDDRHYRAAPPPVYNQDGFEQLVSDEEYDPPKGPKIPMRMKRSNALVRHSLVDVLFSVRVHSPDLLEIFPNISRRDLKRTSSAVWRTPPPAASHQRL